MGGDSVITHELSDRLAEDLMNERFTALVSHMENGEQYLSAEWVSAMFRLRDQEMATGRQLFTPDMFAFAVKESAQMKGLDWLKGYDIREMYEGKPTKLFKAAQATYYAHSGIHSMYYRRDRLMTIAEISRFRAESRTKPDNNLLRKLANVHEELAFYDMLDNRSTAHLQDALVMNQYLVENMDSWRYPYRIHALMSLYDLEAMELLNQGEQVLNFPDRSEELKQVHVGLNTALISVAGQIDKHAEQDEWRISQVQNPRLRKTLMRKSESDLSGMSGALAEGLAMSIVQDHILSNGLQKQLWIRQAFLREDSMSAPKLQIGNETEDLSVINLSFDLQIYNHQDSDASAIPVEVKKVNNSKLKKSLSSLHPDIRVVTFDNTRPQAFAKTARDFAKSQIEKFTSEKMPRQSRIHKEITSRVEPGRLFA